MHAQTALANWMVAACGESNTPCLKNSHTNTKKFSFTSDMSLVLPKLWLKFVRHLLEKTAIFARSFLYLARTTLGTTAGAKIALPLWRQWGKVVCYKCHVCGAATPTSKNAINEWINELHYYDHSIAWMSSASWAVFGSLFHISACHCSISRLKLACFE